MLSTNIAFLIVSVVCVAGKEDKIVEQIYHGEPSSVVAHNYVLTAGHCCAEPGKKYVVIGGVDHERFYEVANKNKTLNVTGYWTYAVAKQHLHPKYQTRKFTVMHDVCLLELETAMNENIDGHSVAPVSYMAFFSQQCTAVGWGQTEENKMQFKLYHKKVFAESSWRGNWLLRLYFHTICSGDSGGPLLCGGRIFGIASFSTTHKCSVPGIDYYAYLHEEEDFLSDYVSQASSTSYEKLYLLLLISLLMKYKKLLLYD